MYKVSMISKSFLADITSSIGLYLRARDVFSRSIMLESSNYQDPANSRTYIGMDEIASFTYGSGVVREVFPDRKIGTRKIKDRRETTDALKDFMNSFSLDYADQDNHHIGLLGYIAYDAVDCFEDIELRKKKYSEDVDIPEISFSLFQYVLEIDHFKNQARLFQFSVGENKHENRIDEIQAMLYSGIHSTYTFKMIGRETSYISDKDFLAMVKKAKKHCLRGDVFQVVLSRRYSHSFSGDDFNVYRALRSINPSPYLFFLNYENYRIFGSSPEAHLIISDGKAEIHPIAGTFKRTGDRKHDDLETERLKEDEKENAEHVMLVDLARNDLSRSCTHVHVSSFQEVQNYSHVIHLMSKVEGKIKKDCHSLDLLANTFPAGTLSGSPKYRAMQIIDEQEESQRLYYGGAVGMLGFDHSINMAIMIRTFLSINNVLFYQAGAGIVAKSVPEREKLEVDHKLGALREALSQAGSIN